MTGVALRRERRAVAAVSNAAGRGDLDALAQLLATHCASERIADAALAAVLQHLLAMPEAASLPNTTLRSLNDSCLAVLRTHATQPSSATILTHAFLTLIRTVFDSGSRQDMTSAQIFAAAPAFAVAIRLNIGDVKLVHSAATVLLNTIVRYEAWQEDAAAAVDLLEPVVAALRHRMGTPNFEAFMVSRLVDLISELVRAPAIAARGEAAGALEAVVSAMRRTPTDALLQERGCCALYKLTRRVRGEKHYAYPSAAIANAAVETVLAALAAHPQGSNELCFHGLRATVILWRADFMPAFGGSVTRCVLRLISTRLQHRRVVLACLSMLSSMLLEVNDLPLPRNVDARECVRAVLAVMRTYKSDGKLQGTGALTLVLLESNTAAGFHAFQELDGNAVIDVVIRAHPGLEEVIAELRQDAKRPVCKGPSCGVTSGGADNIKLRSCAGCMQTMYCSQLCQVAHWHAGHKAECRAAQAAAALQHAPTAGDVGTP